MAPLPAKSRAAACFLMFITDPERHYRLVAALKPVRSLRRLLHQRRGRGVGDQPLTRPLRGGTVRPGIGISSRR
jgi:hypothetical protein